MLTIKKLKSQDLTLVVFWEKIRKIPHSFFNLIFEKTEKNEKKLIKNFQKVFKKFSKKFQKISEIFKNEKNFKNEKK